MAVSGRRRVLRGQLRREGVDQPDVQVRRGAGEQGRKSHGPPSPLSRRFPSPSPVGSGPSRTTIVAAPVGRRTGGFRPPERRWSLTPIRSSRRRFFFSHYREDFPPRTGGTIFLWARVSRAENYVGTLPTDNKPSRLFRDTRSFFSLFRTNYSRDVNFFLIFVGQ